MNASQDSPISRTPLPTSLLPLRMLNEFVYCPRLFHLEHVEGRWADNTFTIEGRQVHRRVDKLDHVLPDAEASEADEVIQSKGSDDGDEPPTITRSVPLSSTLLGITGKLDLVATAGTDAVPVETKRGRVPNNEQRSYEPERVQLMAQGLLLREHGYTCDHGCFILRRVSHPSRRTVYYRARNAYVAVYHKSDIGCIGYTIA